MESSLTVADYLALNRGNGYDSCHGRGKGMAATAIGLAAGLGGGALLLAIAGIWGANKASEARNQAAMALANANNQAIGQMCNAMANERNSRETWQNRHAPTVSQYVDVQSSAGAGAGANALSNAEALAILNQSNGLNSAIGGCNFLRVARYSAPQPCGCDTCCGN